MWWKFFSAVRRGQYKVAPITWIALVGTAVYAVVPVDFIPELILGPIGLVDDLGLLGVAAVLATREKKRWEAQLAYDDGIIDVDPLD